jgi:hypothetical protein
VDCLSVVTDWTVKPYAYIYEDMDWGSFRRGDYTLEVSFNDTDRHSDEQSFTVE